MSFITLPDKTVCLLNEAETARRKPPLWGQLLIFLAIFMTIQTFMSVPLLILTFGDIFELIAPYLEIEAINGIDINEFTNQIMAISMLPMLFLTIITTLTAMLYCKTIELRPLSSMGFVKKNWFSQYALGFFIGFLLFGGYILIGTLSGTIVYRGFTADGMWISIGLFFLGFVIQGMSEEVLLRGYFMVSLCNKVSVFWAVLINSVFFSLLHTFNPGISPIALFNIALFGIVMSLYFLLTGNIWGVSAIHTSWNFLQGNVFGSSVSGMQSGGSVFSFAPTEGSTLLTGGRFGPEGGIIATMILSAACLILILLLRKKKSKLV